MKRDDDSDLWDLLGRAAQPKVSPFFARNVLREIRRGGDWKTFRGWLNPRSLVPVAGMAAVLIAVFLLRLQTPVGPLANPPLDTLASIDALEYEVIADLDDLFAADDNNLLEESFLL